MNKTISNICLYCDEEIPADDVRTDEDGDTLCYECWCDHCQFTCCLCQEYGDIEDQHNYVVVFDAEGSGIEKPGLYRVKDKDYYTEAMIGSGWLHKWAIEFMSDVPVGAESDYPCGHICLECQKKIAHPALAKN